MSSDSFSLFTSLRYDVGLKQVPDKKVDFAGWNYRNESNLYMLDFHRDRLLRAATHWQWQKAIDVLAGDDALKVLAQKVEEAVGENQEAPLRLRIVVNPDGEMLFQKFNTPPMSLENLFPVRLPTPGSAPGKNEPGQLPLYVLLPDYEGIARSEFTHFKTTKRAMYDAARERTGIAPTDAKEVLLVNQDDSTVMEGSTTTPFFWRDGKWVTPPVSTTFSLEDGSGGQDGTSRRWALERGLAIEQVVKVDSLTDGEQCWISNGVRGFFAAVIRLKQSTGSWEAESVSNQVHIIRV